MIDPAALRRRAPPIDRSRDRLVALGAIVVAVAFLVAALLSLAMPAASRLGLWLPLHLALAGGASTAIAGVLPFFVAAFAAAPPSDARLRTAAVAAIASGAVAVAIGFVGTTPGLTVAGGSAFVGGVLLTAAAGVRPLGRALGPSRGLVTRAYVVALGEVALGATIATLFAAGWPPLVEGWLRMKPAHAWLNLAGFVSLVIATTLLHFFPTVVGARIVVRPSARVTVGGLALGPPVVAAGIVLDTDLVARLGAAAVVAGAAALAVYAWRTWAGRGHWTTDPGWHRFAMGGLISAIAWLEAGVAIAAGRVFAFGADPASWSTDTVAGPLVAGWMALAVLASATHLLPAVGPGDPAAHARQRQLLGSAAGARLALANVGVAGIAVGLPTSSGLLVQAGAVALAIAVGGTAALLIAAVRIGLSGRPRGGS
ncbi:MAG TPA: hypothetical protein VFT20_05150 [Candidatus Limnocylindrales bacterium]|nr:hypothetical protein [Candidatus Limnocylindrales bacterium]